MHVQLSNTLLGSKSTPFINFAKVVFHAHSCVGRMQKRLHGRGKVSSIMGSVIGRRCEIGQLYILHLSYVAMRRELMEENNLGITF